MRQDTNHPKAMNGAIFSIFFIILIVPSKAIGIRPMEYPKGYRPIKKAGAKSDRPF